MPTEKSNCLPRFSTSATVSFVILLVNVLLTNSDELPSVSRSLIRSWRLSFRATRQSALTLFLRGILTKERKIYIYKIR